jgi:hypothetical protein
METAAELMAFAGGNTLLLTKAANIEAVTDAGRRAVITSGENPLVPDQNRADIPSGTGGALGNKLSYRHEILMP